MNLEEQTKRFIDSSVRKYYYKAIECGAVISPVELIGVHTYKIMVGNMELIYLGTADGTAKQLSVSGDIK